MFFGVPFICIMIYGTLYFAITLKISLSIFPADISFIISAPSKIHSFAVFDQNVSIERMISLKVFFNNFIVGRSFFNSSLEDI